MTTTGSPWLIPYAEPSDLVRDWPSISENVADAAVAGLVGAARNVSQTITATDTSWAVPSLANPIVRVIVIGAGGGGGASVSNTRGSAGGSTTFGVGTGFEVVASGGAGGVPASNGSTLAGGTATDGFCASNGGQGGTARLGSCTQGGTAGMTGNNGLAGQIKVAYIDLTGVSTVNIAIGAGGAGSTGTANGSSGGRGEVIVEYVEEP